MGLTRKSKDYSTEDVAGGVHVQGNRYQVAFAQAKEVYHLQSSKTTLTASVGHSSKLCGARLRDHRFEPQGPVVVCVGSGRQDWEWLWLGRLLHPAFIQA